MSDDPPDRLGALALAMQALFERFEGAYNSLHADAADLRTDVLGELGKTRADIMGKIAELQDGITGMRDDLSVTFGAADSVRRAHNNTRAEMRDLSESVSALYRKLARLETQMREIKGDDP